MQVTWSQIAKAETTTLVRPPSSLLLWQKLLISHILQWRALVGSLLLSCECLCPRHPQRSPKLFPFCCCCFVFLLVFFVSFSLAFFPRLSKENRVEKNTQHKASWLKVGSSNVTLCISPLFILVFTPNSVQRQPPSPESHRRREFYPYFEIGA